MRAIVPTGGILTKRLFLGANWAYVASRQIAVIQATDLETIFAGAAGRG